MRFYVDNNLIKFISYMVKPELRRTHSWMAWLIGVSIACALLVTLWSRFVGAPFNDEPGAVQWQLTLNFEDRSNGDVAVIDPGNRLEIARYVGEQGFVRGALRALARERKRSLFGPEHPFELTGYVNGRVTLRDPSTGMRLNLESFGPENAAMFSRLQFATPAKPAVFVAPASLGKT